MRNVIGLGSNQVQNPVAVTVPIAKGTLVGAPDCHESMVQAAGLHNLVT